MVRDGISWTDCLFHHRSVELALLLNSRIENTMSWPSTFKSSQCGKTLAVFIEMSRQVSIKMSISSIYQNVAPVSIKMSRQNREDVGSIYQNVAPSSNKFQTFNRCFLRDQNFWVCNITCAKSIEEMSGGKNTERKKEESFTIRPSFCPLECHG